VRKLRFQKNNKKQAANNSSELPKLSQIGIPGGGQIAAKVNLFGPFSILAPKWAQESSWGPKKLPKGVQKVPKGNQKVEKRREKHIQKASTRHPNAISKCIGNSIHNSRSNAIANAIANAIDNRRPLHTLM